MCRGDQWLGGSDELLITENIGGMGSSKSVPVMSLREYVGGLNVAGAAVMWILVEDGMKMEATRGRGLGYL